MEGVLRKCEDCGHMIMDRGIPVPERQRGKWDFLSDMEVGDSFIVTTHDEFEKVRGAMYHRKLGIRTRKEPDGTGWRVWRIS